MAEERPVALVTGASSGIGSELVRQLAERGYDCVITARRADRLEALKAEVESASGGAVDVIAHDLGEAGSGAALAAKVDALGKPVSLLVNNAGFGMYGPLVDNDPARLQLMIELNMVSLTALTRHYAIQMVERGHGYVLQVSSVGAYQPSPYYAVYSATKSYVLSFSEAMNWELKKTGVSVTTICPGLTATEFHQVAEHEKPKAMDKVTMTASAVAAIGLKALFKRRAVVTPGAVNKINAFFVKLLPRSWACAVAGSMMAKKPEAT